MLTRIDELQDILNRLKIYAIGLFIVIVPLFHSKSLDLRTIQEIGFQYSSIAIISLFFGNIWLTLFMLLNIFLISSINMSCGQGQVMNIFIGCLLFLVSRNYFKKNDIKMIYRPIVILSVLSILFMSLQLFGIDPIFQRQDAGGMRVPGLFSDPVGIFALKSSNATFLSISIPFLMALSSFTLYLSPLFFIPIILCQSSFSMIAGIASFLFYLFYRNRKMFLIFLAIFSIAGSIYIFKDLKNDSMTFKSRFPVWHSCVRYALSNPIGYGPDSYRNFTKHKDFLFMSDEKYRHGIAKKFEGDSMMFKYYLPDNDIEKEKELDNLLSTIDLSKMSLWDNPHNGYLTLLFQYGILGLLLLIGLMVEMYYRFIYSLKSHELIVISAALLAYFVASFAHFPLELARTAYLFPILLGGFYALTDVE